MLEIAYNLVGLDDRQVLKKLKDAHDAVAAKPLVYTTPNPSLASVLADHDAAEDILDDIDSLEAQLITLRQNRGPAMEAVRATYHSFGAYVLNKANGNPAIVTEATYALAKGPSAPPTMGKVAGNMVTPGEDDGKAKGKWDRMEGAKSYEIEIATNPAGPWTHYLTVTVSHVEITGQTSGVKLWTRVRAINKHGPGPWSDPACCTVP